jgi:hypothetical protein
MPATAFGETAANLAKSLKAGKVEAINKRRKYIFINIYHHIVLPH